MERAYMGGQEGENEIGGVKKYTCVDYQGRWAIPTLILTLRFPTDTFNSFFNLLPFNYHMIPPILHLCSAMSDMG